MNIWAELLAPSALRPCGNNTCGVQGRSCITQMQRHREEITCKEEFPPGEPGFSHLYSSLHRRKQLDFFSRASHGECTEWSSVQWDRAWCSRVFAEGFALQSRFGHSPELISHLAAAAASGTAGRDQGTPWLSSPLLNHLLLSAPAALRCCCHADLPSVVLTGLHSNESKTGSSFQGCLYAKEGVKA